MSSHNVPYVHVLSLNAPSALRAKRRLGGRACVTPTWVRRHGWVTTWWRRQDMAACLCTKQKRVVRQGGGVGRGKRSRYVATASSCSTVGYGGQLCCMRRRFDCRFYGGTLLPVVSHWFRRSSRDAASIRALQPSRRRASGGRVGSARIGTREAGRAMAYRRGTDPCPTVASGGMKGTAEETQSVAWDDRNRREDAERRVGEKTRRRDRRDKKTTSVWQTDSIFIQRPQRGRRNRRRNANL